jgi:hypothetical protein
MKGFATDTEFFRKVHSDTEPKPRRTQYLVSVTVSFSLACEYTRR